MRLPRAQRPARRSSISRPPTACGTRCGVSRPADRDGLVAAFKRSRRSTSPTGIIGRQARPARIRTCAAAVPPVRTCGDGAGSGAVLAVAFPHDQVQMLPYNRVVKDLARSIRRAFMADVRERFAVSDGPATPARRGRDRDVPRGPLVHAGAAGQAVGRRSDRLARCERAAGSAARSRCSASPTSAPTSASTSSAAHAAPASSKQLVDSGKAAVAFSLYPVSVADLMAVSDAGEIMPPKSTWFEPKLRDGLLVHLI